MTKDFSIRGLIADFSVFTSKDNLESFLAITRFEEIEKTPISSRLYRTLFEEPLDETLMLLRRWERKKISREWMRELRRYREIFMPCNQIVESDEYLERWNKLPEKVQNQVKTLLEKSKGNLLVEAFTEMFVVSLIMDYPIVAFSRQFQRQLRTLRIPTFDTLVACFEHLKRLKRKKKIWHKKISEFVTVSGRRRHISTIILITVAIATGLAAWQVTTMFLSLTSLAISEPIKEVLESATAVLIGAVVVDGKPS